MRVSGWLIVALLSGCGRVAFELHVAPANDATPLGSGPFGPPVALDVVGTTAGESDPSLTADMLEMYFDSDRPGIGSSDIYQTTRASVMDPWGPPVLVTELSSVAFDGASGITPDGLTIYITTNRAGGAGGFDIWRSTRPDRGDAWSAPGFVAELSSPDDDSNPQPADDDLRIWLSSKRGGLSERQLYRASRASTTSPWAPPVEVSELNASPTTSTEAPWFAADDLEVFFASNRTGTQGANDLWYATRAAPGELFGAPIAIEELNTSAGDQDPWLSADRHVIVFMSRRTGNPDLYIATR